MSRKIYTANFEKESALSKDDFELHFNQANSISYSLRSMKVENPVHRMIIPNHFYAINQRKKSSGEKSNFIAQRKEGMVVRGMRMGSKSLRAFY